MAFENRFACEKRRLTREGRDEEKGGREERTCLVISSCSSRAKVANASYLVPICQKATRGSGQFESAASEREGIDSPAQG